MLDDEEVEKVVKGLALLLGLTAFCISLGGATHWYAGVAAWGVVIILAAIVAS